MNQFEFIKFEKTQIDPLTGQPSEKHLGIATIKCWGKIYLKYKITQGKDGNGIFPAVASYKIRDEYEDSFELESNYENKEIKRIVMENSKKALSMQLQPNQNPGWTPNPYIQPNPQIQQQNLPGIPPNHPDVARWSNPDGSLPF